MSFIHRARPAFQKDQSPYQPNGLVSTYKGTLLANKRIPLAPYRRTMSKLL